VLGWPQRTPPLRSPAGGPEPRPAEPPHHRVGFVHEAMLEDHPTLQDVEVYAAGPPAMIEALRATTPQRGLPEDRLYFDSFDYAPDAARAARTPRE